MGLWPYLCPALCAAEWPREVLRRALQCVGLGRCLRTPAENELQQKRLGNLSVRTNSLPQDQPETPANAALHISRWSNAIRTTQYSWWSFLPLNLWAQITQPANFYFLAMAVLQMLPAISDSDGVPTFLFPLLIVMTITAAKDAYENIKRYQADRTENESSCYCFQEGHLRQVRWAELRPGDVIKLYADDPVPADIVLLNCSDPYGVAYIDTLQLDGESNLKNKTCVPSVAKLVQNDFDAATVKLEIQYEPPSAELYKFSGSILILDSPTAPRTDEAPSASCEKTGLLAAESAPEGKRQAAFDKSAAASPSPRTAAVRESLLSRARRSSISAFENLSAKVLNPHTQAAPAVVPAEAAAASSPSRVGVDICQFLCRGATVRNTEWVFGLVVYTGHSTRIMKNTKQRELKYSHTQVVYNQHAVLLAAAQFALCVIAAIAFASKNQSLSDSAWYLDNTWSPGVSNFVSSLGVAFGRFVLLLSYFVPITLLVQLEVCRWAQAGFLSADERMRGKGGLCATAQSMALMDELGAVTHVFTDKTGTLTQNLMQFRCMAVGGEIFGYDEFEEEKSFVSADSFQSGVRCVPSRHSSVSALGGGTFLKHGTKSLAEQAAKDPNISPNPFVSFNKTHFSERIAKSDARQQRRAQDFLMVLSLCHSVLPKPHAATPQPLEGLFREQDTPQKAASPHAGTLQNSQNSQASQNPKDSQRQSPTESPASAECKSGDPLGDAVSQNAEKAVEGEDETPRALGSVSSLDFLKNTESPLRTPPAVHRGFREEPTQHAPLPSSRNFLCDSSNSSASAFSDEASSDDENSSGCVETPRDVCVSSGVFRGADSGSEESRPKSLLRRWLPREGISPDQEAAASRALRYTQTPSLHKEPPLRSGIAELSGQTSHSPSSQPRVGEEPASDSFSRASQRLDSEGLGLASSSLPPQNSAFQSVLSGAAQSPSGMTACDALGRPLYGGSSFSPALQMQRQRAQPPLSLAFFPGSLEANYDASSPDELALTAAAKHLGAEFVCRPNLNSIQLALRAPFALDAFLTMRDRVALDELRRRASELPCLSPLKAQEAGEEKSESSATTGPLNQEDLVPILTVDVLEVLEFDNYRKRMSVIVRDREGFVRVLVKGADNSMFDIAAPGQREMVKECKTHLSEMAQRGLRTLVLGQRYLSERQLERYQADLASAGSLAGEEKEQALAAVIARVEKNIELLGCTGIDDKLQDDVVETIADLKAAGVKVWVLTGDKLETAISIGHSCSVLTDRTYNAIVDGKTQEQVKEQLHQYMSYVVAAQLASEAFERIALKSLQTLPDDASDCSRMHLSEQIPAATAKPQRKQLTPAACCTKASGSATCSKASALCMGRPVNAQDATASLGFRRAEPPTMAWDAFVRILTFNATRKVVRADPKQRRNKRLSPRQVEKIVQEYLDQFERESEEGRAKEKKAKREASRRRSSKRHVSQTPRSLSARASESLASDALTASGHGSLKQNAEKHANNNAAGGDAQGPSAATFAFDSETPPPLNKTPSSPAKSGLPQTAANGSGLAEGGGQQSVVGGGASSGRSLSEREEPAVQGYQECALTITGEALNYALSTGEHRRYFFGLASLCSTLIACRVSPKQKSEVVTQCQRYSNSTVSLGIGDGANDVGMLIAANVGVGIRGKEGLQAVRAADFSVSEFKFLKNLLFCHGSEALRRNSFQIYQTIWKNVVFGLADFFFAFVSTWSAADLFNSWLKQLFNVLYTTLPVVLYSIFDRQLPLEVTLQTPVLYPAFSKLGVQRFAGSRLFARWFVYGVYAAVACVFLPLYGLGWAFGANPNEKTVLSVRFAGTAVFWSIIVVCNLILVPYLHTWFWFIWAAVLLNFAFWFISVGVCPVIPGEFCPDLAGALQATHVLPRYHLSVILACFVALLPPFLYWFHQTLFRPSAQTVIRERISKGVFDVVVAPRGGPKMAVVVPKTHSEEWRGFAFAEQDRTRLGHHRMSVIRPGPVPASSSLLYLEEQLQEFASAERRQNEASSDSRGNPLSESASPSVDQDRAAGGASLPLDSAHPPAP